MTDLAAGVDMVEIERVRRLLARHPERFRRRVFTPTELAVSRDRPHQLAARFAAKEATMKALGTGAKGVSWREIEVLPDKRGKPLLFLYGRAEKRAREMGLTSLEVSLTHSREYALATVVALREGGGEDAQAARRSLLDYLQRGGPS